MTRKAISLNDDNWRVGSVSQKPFEDVNDLAQVKEWLPAQVPGDVRLDLLRAGKIADPFVVMNNEESQWIDELDWWYVRDLNIDVTSVERAFLIFEGIDYQSAVFLNGVQLGRHVGMFSRQIYKIPSPVARRQPSDKAQLTIRVWGSEALPKLNLSRRYKLWKWMVKPLFSLPNEPFPDRYATLKCQMQFGWDFAPRLRTCGIWDEASIVIARSVFIEDVRINGKVQSLNVQVAEILVSLMLDSSSEQRVCVECNVHGKNFASGVQEFVFDLGLSRGKKKYSIEFDLDDAREWNPWDRGEPNVYEVEIRVLSEAGEPLDSYSTTFGIRSIELMRKGVQQDPWTFMLNGKSEFVRGANWVPLDAIPGRLSRKDYAARLKQVRDANINFLRVWGGGLREKRAFYDLCDELGILVWQEFPFAGAILDRFPRDRAFLNFVRDECGAIVRSLRNHPSLVVWCGGNEFNTRGNRAVVETLRQVVASADGTRVFKPASPYRDESHNWRVWHRSANVRDYKKDRTPFLSEFGMQSAPNVESLEKFLAREALFPPNALWEYHHAELKKLGRYANSTNSWSIFTTLGTKFAERLAALGNNKILTCPGERCQGRSAKNDTKELHEFVSATQHAQAMALQIAIEHMRRRKIEHAAGVAVWQFNDCWPAISWSLVDYYGVPKLAYYALRRSYSPVLASFDYPLEPRTKRSQVQGNLWAINDLTLAFPDTQLTASLNRQPIFSRRLNIASDSAEQVDTLAIQLNQGENILQLKLERDAEILSENEYDLNYCDHGEINPLVTMFVAVGNKLTR